MVSISPRGSIVYIKTDKPRYQPGQSVLMNIIIMDPDLKPLPVKDIGLYNSIHTLCSHFKPNKAFSG